MTTDLPRKPFPLESKDSSTPCSLPGLTGEEKSTQVRVPSEEKGCPDTPCIRYVIVMSWQGRSESSEAVPLGSLQAQHMLYAETNQNYVHLLVA